LNLINPIENSKLNYVTNKPLKQTINYALKNALGFGGTNTSILFKKFKIN